MAVAKQYTNEVIDLQSIGVFRTKLCVVRERKRRRLIFYIPNLTLRSLFNFEIFLIMRNKLNDYRVSRDSLVKYSASYKK